MNTAMVRYVGLDVHKRVVQACIVDQAGKVVHRERFALCRRTLETFATEVLRPTDHVALEATTNCWAVADALRPHVARVVVSNPMATKAIAQAKVKTDKVDAHVLSDGDHAASYLGLVPSTRQSANCCYHGPITKRGNSQARWMLTEAAQHLDKHPGPLGHFFRRLCRKKNRNVAMVAAARKLAWIGWRMLVTGEPYRYADPRTTTNKLARLRVKVTGVRRKTGPAKGQKPVAKLPGGSHTIKALATVYQSEGLPQPWPLPPGEQRTVKQAGCEEFVARIGQTHVVPRTKRAVTGSSSLLRSNGRDKH